jgi:hypothetical protein
MRSAWAFNSSIESGEGPMDDETDVTDITILPDGRVYVFGLSGPILEVLQTLQSDDERVQRLLSATTAAPASDGGGSSHG